MILSTILSCPSLTRIRRQDQKTIHFENFCVSFIWQNAHGQTGIFIYRPSNGPLCAMPDPCTLCGRTNPRNSLTAVLGVDSPRSACGRLLPPCIPHAVHAWSDIKATIWLVYVPMPSYLAPFSIKA
jgi:hypothetical protein